MMYRITVSLLQVAESLAFPPELLLATVDQPFRAALRGMVPSDDRRLRFWIRGCLADFAVSSQGYERMQR